MRMIRLIALASLFVAAGGCVELGIISGAGSNGGSTPPTTDGDSGNDSVNDVLRVQLSVSNTNPTISEEVILRCLIVEGSSAGVVFSYQPNTGRLSANPATGTASFIVAESDVGTAFRYTCTAESASVTSELSNQVLIIPTG